MGSFVFKWPHPDANDVHVTGTFDDWGKSEKLNKVGDVWEKEVELSQTDKKILYKFVVDDNWVIDHTAPQEDDGHGNLNNVLHPDQIKTKPSVVPEAFTTSSAAPESTTAALAGQVPLEPRKEASEETPAGESSHTKETSESSLPGAFPETPQREPDSFGVHPLPATSGDSNPVNVPAGEKLPPQSDVTTDNLQSNVTTSKEDYEKAGEEPESFGVNPLPATSGDSNPVNIPAGEKLPPQSDITANNVESNVTTSKEDYDKAGTEPDAFSVNPIPATSGPGNPVDLAPGQKVPEPSQFTSNSIYSSVTTSREDYDKAGSSIPFIGGAFAGAGLGAAAASGSSSDKKENLIPESSLPIGADAGNTLDAGPTVSSAGPTSTTADLAGKVPLEERKAATVIDPQTTTETVPEVVKESIAEAHTSPEATTSAEAVKEKAEVEQELLKKVHSTDEAGEPAPTMTAATSTAVPAATLGTTSSAAAAVSDGTEATETPGEVPRTTAPAEKTEGDNTEYAPPHATGSAPGVSPAAAAALSDGTEDPTLADEPAVQYLQQNEAETTGIPAGASEQTAAPTEAKGDKPSAAGAVVPSTSEAPKSDTPAVAPPEAKKETAAAPATASSVASTPKKSATTTPTTSPASGSASKEKKKKNRISSLFKKIFD